MILALFGLFTSTAKAANQPWCQATEPATAAIKTLWRDERLRRGRTWTVGSGNDWSTAVVRDGRLMLTDRPEDEGTTVVTLKRSGEIVFAVSYVGPEAFEIPCEAARSSVSAALIMLTYSH